MRIREVHTYRDFLPMRARTIALVLLFWCVLPMAAHAEIPIQIIRTGHVSLSIGSSLLAFAQWVKDSCRYPERT
jgi:hypothetical protein